MDLKFRFGAVLEVSHKWWKNMFGWLYGRDIEVVKEEHTAKLGKIKRKSCREMHVWWEEPIVVEPPHELNKSFLI